MLQEDPVGERAQPAQDPQMSVEMDVDKHTQGLE